MEDKTDDGDLDRMVDTFEAARLLGQAPGTLRKKRIFGGGCCYHKIGKSVRYSVRDLELFKAKNRVASTGEHWQAA